MGETIDGQFGNAASIRTEHAVRFTAKAENGRIEISAEDGASSFHVFDIQGRCRISGRLHEGTNHIDASMLGQGIYVVWATDKDGYRNAVKVTVKK